LSAGINNMDSRYFTAISDLQVNCSHELCQKIQVPALVFSEVCMLDWISDWATKSTKILSSCEDNY